MKRMILSSLLFSMLSTITSAQLKYVFLFIGDGMGLAQRSLAEFMLHAKENPEKPGVSHLLMNEFPVQSLMHTISGDSYITDSAAAGTAMARGVKTYQGGIGVNLQKEEIESAIFKKARERNMKLGIATTAPMDHATPASFYAQVESRYMNYEIGAQFAKAGIDYAGGGCTSYSVRFKLKGRKPPTELAAENGYDLIQTNAEFEAYNHKDRRVWAMDENCLKAKSDIPYAVETRKDQLTLTDYVQKGIELMDNPDGFFFMIESGKIDWAGHANDAATAAREVIAMDEAVAKAYDFYMAHPHETLILVTADHETGGLALGSSKMKYVLKPHLLWNQKMSMKTFTYIIPEWKEKGISFEKARDFIVKNFGLDNLQNDEEKLLKTAYDMTMNPDKADKDVPDFLYTKGEPLAITAVKIMDDRVGIGWTTVKHTGVPVPVSAIGYGQAEFSGLLDNTDIYTNLSQLLER